MVNCSLLQLKSECDVGLQNPHMFHHVCVCEILSLRHCLFVVTQLSDIKFSIDFKSVVTFRYYELGMGLSSNVLSKCTTKIVYGKFWL